MKNNSQNINYLTGNQKIHSIAVEPFNNEVCNFIADLSKNLDSNPKSKLFPDIKTLAFWCRKSNLLNLRKNFHTDFFVNFLKNLSKFLYKNLQNISFCRKSKFHQFFFS